MSISSVLPMSTAMNHPGYGGTFLIQEYCDAKNYLGGGSFADTKQFNKLATSIRNDLPDKVALKIPKANWTKQARIDFQREVKAITSLKEHVNLLKCYGTCDIFGKKALVTELCDLDLKSLLQQRTRLGYEDVISIIIQVIDGLQALHCGQDEIFSHGDLKPENILILKDNNNLADISRMTFKLGDFGFSRNISNPSGTFSVVGTEMYMAPELKDPQNWRLHSTKLGRHKVHYNLRYADVYALGVIVKFLRFKLDLGVRPLLDIFASNCCRTEPKQRPESKTLDEFFFECLRWSIHDFLSKSHLEHFASDFEQTGYLGKNLYKFEFGPALVLNFFLEKACRAGVKIKKSVVIVKYQGAIESAALKNALEDQLKSDFQILFSVGGYATSKSYHTAEFSDLSGKGRKCPKVKSFPNDRGSFGTFINNTALVCGGYNPHPSKCYAYHPDLDDWSFVTEMSRNRAHSEAIQLDDKRWWVTGNDWQHLYRNTTEIFYSSNQTFGEYLELPRNRSFHQLIRLNETHIMLLGDYNPTKEVWMFDQATAQWTQLPDTRVSRHRPMAGLVTFNDGSKHVLLAGGINEKSSEYFSLADWKWSNGPKLPFDICCGCVAQTNETFYMVGGNQLTDNYKLILKFDTKLKDWEIRPEQLSLPRNFFACFWVPNDFVTCQG